MKVYGIETNGGGVLVDSDKKEYGIFNYTGHIGGAHYFYIKPILLCKRPAVSMITTSALLALAELSVSKATEAPLGVPHQLQYEAYSQNY